MYNPKLYINIPSSCFLVFILLSFYLLRSAIGAWDPSDLYIEADLNTKRGIFGYKNTSHPI